jgi:hypothetical protein
MQNIIGKYGFLAERVEVDSSMDFQQQVLTRGWCGRHAAHSFNQSIHVTT